MVTLNSWAKSFGVRVQLIMTETNVLVAKLYSRGIYPTHYQVCTLGFLYLTMSRIHFHFSAPQKTVKVSDQKAYWVFSKTCQLLYCNF